MTAQVQTMTAGQKAWATRRARLGLATGQILTEEETIEQQRARWQEEFEVRCEALGKRPSGDWDPDKLRAAGFAHLADHVLRNWGKPWHPRQRQINLKLVKRHADRQKARREWKFA